MIKGIYDFLDSRERHNNFTIGIKDDVTNLSIDYDEGFTLPHKATEFLVYGYGSDGMVSASKDIMKITGDNTRAFVQGYFQYDSKKSGGYTLCHLRFSTEEIKSTYYVEKPTLVVCTKDSYLSKLKMLDKIKTNGTFLINTNMSDKDLLNAMTNHDKKILQKKNIKVYKIDASRLADEVGLPGKISTIMEALIFKLGKVIDFDFAKDVIKKSIEKRFSTKAGDLVEKNSKVIDGALDYLEKVKIPDVSYDDYIEKKKNIFEIINSLEGNSLPVSAFLPYQDGTYRSDDVKLDMGRNSLDLPCYNSKNCITCNLCSLVCPHGVIRPFLLDEKEVMDAPKELQERLIDANIKGVDYKFIVGMVI